jgi:hypothetical protein
MSFMLTEQQYVDGTKDVTRRLGWLTLKPGDKFMGVNKAMGLKKGEKSRELGAAVVVSVRREPLFWITDADVAREGFPGKTGEWFVEMFCNAMKCGAAVEVTRIEFKRLSAEEGGAA